MSIWHWLGNNSTQIQAAAGVAAVIVAAIVGWVAWKQKLAAEAQAEAAAKQTIAAQVQAETAAKQTIAAEVQAEASRQQVMAAKQQTEASLLIAERQMAPYISLNRSQAPNPQNAARTIEVANNGIGPALGIVAKYDDDLPGNDDLKAPNDALAVGNSFSLWLTDDMRAARTGVRITYETMLGTKYALSFQWNGNVQQAVNQKLIKLLDPQPASFPS